MSGRARGRSRGLRHESPYNGLERAQIERLEHDGCTKLLRQIMHVGRVHPRNRNDGRSPLRCPNAFEEFEATQDGHVHVGDDECHVFGRMALPVLRSHGDEKPPMTRRGIVVGEKVPEADHSYCVGRSDGLKKRFDAHRLREVPKKARFHATVLGVR